MAWPVYSTRFIAAILGTDAQVNAAHYIVPAGKVAIVRSVDFYVDTAGTLLFGLQSGAGDIFFVSSNGVPVNQTRHWEGDHVFAAGERMGCGRIGGTYRLLVSGFLLNAL